MDKSITASIQELTELWNILFPDREPPEQSVWAYWILKHGTPIVKEGILELVSKRRKLKGDMTAEYMAKFASTVMKSLSLKAQQQKYSKMSREEFLRDVACADDDVFRQILAAHK